MDTVIYEKRAPIASITINRPHVMNACDPPTTDYIYECEQNFDQDPDLKVLILTGTGDRAFCTGMDLKAAAARIAEGGPVSNVVPPYMKTDKITIAAVNGYAVAGGLERSLACDIRIASENAQVGCFEIRRGLPNPPDPLIRLIGFGPALHMLLSGDLSGAEKLLAFLIPGVIQFAVGNVVEPKIMGRSLDLHPVAVLLGLIFFGMIWGIIGMILATPIVAITKIVLERIELTAPVVRLLAGKFDPG